MSGLVGKNYNVNPPYEHTSSELAMLIEARFEMLENYLQRIFDRVDLLEVRSYCASIFVVSHLRRSRC
jgi:hypothetical protein